MLYLNVNKTSKILYRGRGGGGGGELKTVES